MKCDGLCCIISVCFAQRGKTKEKLEEKKKKYILESQCPTELTRQSRYHTDVQEFSAETTIEKKRKNNKNKRCTLTFESFGQRAL